MRLEPGLARRSATATVVVVALLLASCGTDDDLELEELVGDTAAPAEADGQEDPAPTQSGVASSEAEDADDAEEPAEDPPENVAIGITKAGECGVVGAGPHPPVPEVTFDALRITTTVDGIRVELPTVDYLLNGDLWINQNRAPGTAYSHWFNIFVGETGGPSIASIQTARVDSGDGLVQVHEIMDLTTGEPFDPLRGVEAAPPVDLTDTMGFLFDPITLPDGLGVTGFEAGVFIDDGTDLRRCLVRIDRGDLPSEAIAPFADSFSSFDEKPFFERLDLEVDWN